MSSESQREWSELSELWRESPEPLDAAAIRRRIRRRSWLASIWFAGELSLCLAALAIAGVFIARWTWPSNLVGVTLLLYTCFALGLTCWSHSTSLSVSTATAADTWKTAVRQARASIRWAQSGLILSAVSLILSPIVVYARLQPDYQGIGSPLSLPLWLRLLVIACFWAPIVWRCIHLLRRGRSELAGLMAIRRELLADDSHG
jgi:hypothetical protein